MSLEQDDPRVLRRARRDLRRFRFSIALGAFAGLVALAPFAAAASPPDSADATPTPGTELALSSQPPGATVFIDGRDCGLTPVIAPVTPGTHSVVVTLSGFRPWGTNVEVLAGKRLPMVVPLEALPTDDGSPDPFADPPADADAAMEREVLRRPLTAPAAPAQALPAPAPPPARISEPQDDRVREASVNQPATRSSVRRTRHRRSTMNRTLSALGLWGYGFGYGQGLGFGARMQAVVARSDPEDHEDEDQDPGVRNELGLEFGLDYTRAGYSQSFPSTFGSFSVNWDYHEVTPLVGLTWNFWLSRHVAVYPKLDIGYRFESWSYTYSASTSSQMTSRNETLAHSGVSSFYFHGVGGIVLRRGPLAFRAEGGWAAIRFGLGIQL